MPRNDDPTTTRPMTPRRLAAPRRRRLRLLSPPSPFTLALAVVVVACATALTATAQQTCSDADGDGNSFCTMTPGYKLKTTSIADPTLLTISNCCERDDSKSAFGTCDSAGPGGAGLGGVQAPMEGDSSWLFQDGTGFAQHLDRFTGLCFSILINPSDCTDSGDPLAAPKCCTKKPPSALQFKIATPTAPSVQPGSKRAGALGNLAKCGISWASGSTMTTRGLKRMTKWEKVASGDHAQFFNVPLTFASKARQATFCLYTNNAVDSSTDCTWESICGLKDGTVPFVAGAGSSSNGVGALDNEYAQGCEIRLVGKKAPATSQCCSPPMSLVSFDSQSGYDDDSASAAKVAAASAVSGGEQAATGVLPPPSAALAVPESSNIVIRARRVGGASSSGSTLTTKKPSASVVLRRGRAI